MSKLSAAFDLGHRVTITAKEEATRLGHPQIDVDHLLLALLITHGSAGTVLRGFGISLDQAREATQATHAELVAGLGITSPALEPRPMLDPSIGDVHYSPRAISLLQSVQTHSSDLALLTALLDEPSGFTVRVLERLGVSEAEVRTAITREPPSDPSVPSTSTPDDPEWLSVTQPAFVPAPPADVWALVSNPSRRPEWDSLMESAAPLPDGSWVLMAARSRPDGHRVRVWSTFARSHQRVIALEPGSLVEWETSWPDRGSRSKTERLRVQVVPATGGTQIELTLALRRRDGWRRTVQRLLAPAERFVMRQLLLAQAASISRVLR